MTILTNIVDTLGLYVILFIFVIAVSICRNTSFIPFIKNFYKNYLAISNYLPISTYFKFFYNGFKKIVKSLVNKVFTFFTKNKK